MLQKQRIFLHAVQRYCEVILNLTRDLSACELHSGGLAGFCDYLDQYVGSQAFQALRDESCAIRDDLAGITYTLLISDASATVCRYTGEPNYEAEVAKTFDKFRQGEVADYKFKLQDFVEMNHIEAGILDFVSQLHP